jgi:hypothetical protein
VRCYYCGRGTELYQADVPTCVVCVIKRKDPDFLSSASVHSRLVRGLEEATIELNELSRTHTRILAEIPSGLPHPDGAQRIRSISQQLSKARANVARAHSRLTHFTDSGIIPEDLS